MLLESPSRTVVPGPASKSVMASTSRRSHLEYSIGRLGPSLIANSLQEALHDPETTKTVSLPVIESNFVGIDVDLCHSRTRANEEATMKSLVGDYLEEHLFTMRKSLVPGGISAVSTLDPGGRQKVKQMVGRGTV